MPDNTTLGNVTIITINAAADIAQYTCPAGLNTATIYVTNNLADTEVPLSSLIQFDDAETPTVAISPGKTVKIIMNRVPSTTEGQTDCLFFYDGIEY